MRVTNQLGRDRDDSGSVDLVTGEHPDLDTCIPQQVECPARVVLQFVLDARQPGQLEVALERVRDDSRHRLVATLDMHARNMVARLKVLVFDLHEPSSRDNGTRM